MNPKTSFLLILLRIFLVIVRCFLLLINKIEIKMQFCLSTIVFNGGGLGNRTRGLAKAKQEPYQCALCSARPFHLISCLFLH